MTSAAFDRAFKILLRRDGMANCDADFDSSRAVLTQHTSVECDELDLGTDLPLDGSVDRAKRS